MPLNWTALWMKFVRHSRLCCTYSSGHHWCSGCGRCSRSIGGNWVILAAENQIKIATLVDHVAAFAKGSGRERTRGGGRPRGRTKTGRKWQTGHGDPVADNRHERGRPRGRPARVLVTDAKHILKLWSYFVFAMGSLHWSVDGIRSLRAAHHFIPTDLFTQITLTLQIFCWSPETNSKFLIEDNDPELFQMLMDFYKVIEKLFKK